MRKWHRWVGFPAALLLVFIALTGLAMQGEQMLTQPQPGHGPSAAAPKLPDDATLAAMVVRIAQGARASNPDIGAESLTIQFVGGKPQGSVGSLAPMGPHVLVDAQTGAVIPQAPKGFDLHLFLLDLHAGFTWGPWGHVYSIVAGLALLTLCVTGLKVYLDLFMRRLANGKRSPFWS